MTVHAAIAASCIWLMFAFNLSRPGFIDRLGNLKGADFLQFYAAGTFARAHRIAGMYGVYQFAAATQAATPGVQGWHYLPVYPPQIAVFFWPLAYSSYLTAFAIWSVVNILIYGLCAAILLRLFPRLAAARFTTIVVALAFPPFYNAVADGQVSILALLCVTGSIYFFIREQDFLAGLVLGCAVFKPPIFLAFAVAGLAVRGFSLVGGMAVAACAEELLTIPFAGIDSIAQYVRFALRLPRVDKLVLAVKPWQMPSLRGFWMLSAPASLATPLWIVSVPAVLFFLVRAWQREADRSIRFALLTISAVLIDPHLYIYDAVILAPAVAAVLARSQAITSGGQQDLLRGLVYLLFLSLLLTPLAQITGFQAAVPLLAALAAAIGIGAKPPVTPGTADFASPEPT